MDFIGVRRKLPKGLQNPCRVGALPTTPAIYLERCVIMTVGYEEVYVPEHPAARKNGCVLKQRVIAEEKLGRYLKLEEVVHHIDNDRTNNHPDNLMVFKDQKSHARFHSNLYSELVCTNGVYICLPIVEICSICEKNFEINYQNQTYCSDNCRRLACRKVVNRPSKEELQKLLKTNNYTSIGKMYGVSGNAVKKWLK